jgi:SOS-response transcriptional repressor LexA
MTFWRVYEVLCCWQVAHPYPPTLRELARALGLRSFGSLWEHLDRLRDLGLVTWDAGKSRTLRVLE